MSPIMVWAWADAPEAFRKLSPHAGDEDWVALVPKGKTQPLWMEEGTAFGCCSVSEHEMEGGGRVYIGAHS